MMNSQCHANIQFSHMWSCVRKLPYEFAKTRARTMFDLYAIYCYVVLRRDYNGLQVAIGKMRAICYNPQCFPQSTRLNEIAAWDALPFERCWCLIC